jgi:hypothetical protein
MGAFTSRACGCLSGASKCRRLDERAVRHAFLREYNLLSMRRIQVLQIHPLRFWVDCSPSWQVLHTPLWEVVQDNIAAEGCIPIARSCVHMLHSAVLPLLVALIIFATWTGMPRSIAGLCVPPCHVHRHSIGGAPTLNGRLMRACGFSHDTSAVCPGNPPGPPASRPCDNDALFAHFWWSCCCRERRHSSCCPAAALSALCSPAGNCSTSAAHDELVEGLLTEQRLRSRIQACTEERFSC